MIPEPWEFALLALAAFRFWKLLADDRILDRPRDWLLAKFPTDQRETYWADFLVCPWCAGFWIVLTWWAAWLIWPHGVLVFAGLWALSAAVGLAASVLDKLTD